MKPTNLIKLEMEARQACVQSWNLWAVQGGMKADEKRGRPLSRIAARAKEFAERKRLMAEFYQALGRLFPLGFSNRWERKGVAA